MKKVAVGLMIFIAMGFHAAVAETNLVAGELKILGDDFHFARRYGRGAGGSIQW